jgi:ABC-2 type transport system ATP-binding protein
MIRAQNLTKTYAGRPAIVDVTFSAEKGEILAFLGPNGAGKTTTMRILTGFLPPTSGRAWIAGHDVTEDSMEVRKRVGYLPETVPLYKDLTVTGYLDFVGRLKGMDRSQRRRRIGTILEECGIWDVKDRTIGKLSKGYRQRVGIAQALLNDPEVLILDEPTVGLDPKQIIEIRELIKNLSGQRTIVLSTHILPEASLLCDRVLIINKGRIVTDDRTEDLKYRLRKAAVFEVHVRGEEEAVRSTLEGMPQVRAVSLLDRPEDGSVRFRVESRDNQDIREELARRVVEAGCGLLGLATPDLSLEDIFLQLVTEEGEVQ